MPNQLAATSKRASFICDRSSWESLEKKASKEGVSVGELIRRAVTATYPLPAKKCRKK